MNKVELNCPAMKYWELTDMSLLVGPGRLGVWKNQCNLSGRENVGDSPCAGRWSVGWHPGDGPGARSGVKLGRKLQYNWLVLLVDLASMTWSMLPCQQLRSLIWLPQTCLFHVLEYNIVAAQLLHHGVKYLIFLTVRLSGYVLLWSIV